MARFIRSLITGGNTPATAWVNIDVNQTIAVGDLIQIDATSRKGVAAIAASTTLYGIAEKDITTGGSVTSADRIPVTLLTGAVINIAVTGGDLAEADQYSTLFDLSDKKTLNKADVTGGMLRVLAFDNTKDTAEVVVAGANLALA